MGQKPKPPSVCADQLTGGDDLTRTAKEYYIVKMIFAARASNGWPT